MTLEDALREDVETWQSLAEERQGRIVELAAELRAARKDTEALGDALATCQDAYRTAREVAQKLWHGTEVDRTDYLRAIGKRDPLASDAPGATE